MSNTAPITCPDLLRKKRDGHELTEEEIELFINYVVNGVAEDCQIGAMLMAIYLNGLSEKETINLTKSMVNSGEKLEWNTKWENLLVDKHSTGGCGDKISLILAPALAACGFKVPMMSGRGLEHTGGTLDKLESIPGFRVELTNSEMKAALETVGCFIAGTTSTLSPGDRELYKRRDITATVDSIPLIVASIVSKKVAEGTKTLIMDVKVGSAGFMKSEVTARDLASKLIKVSASLGVQTRAVLSTMDSPIGHNVGNALEVAEAIECLRGGGPDDIRELVTTLGGVVLQMKGRVKTLDEGKNVILNAIKSGEALKKFQSMLTCQGVVKKVATELCQGNMWTVLPAVAPGQITVIKAPISGRIVEVDALQVAKAVWKLGAGRSKAAEPIDYSVGVKLVHLKGDRVEKGDDLMEIHHKSPKLSSSIRKQLEDSFVIQYALDKPVQSPIITIIS
ncbi:thymidine phosphorylase-like [Periplaneta americana]|uniref:thymidine phosphorylase-like n=1 Tax=Periplaneta americana TaxID=6978 RepID=UPI0037E8F9D9